MCASQFFNVANISSVNIALPDIADDLDFSEATLPWVVSAYLVTFAGFLLVGGRVADLSGRRRVLTAGFVIFLVGTLLSALAPTAPTLVAARALQGIGAATMIPASLGILTTAFSAPAERSRAVAAFGAAGAVGFASGLILGGAVTGTLGWRWIFGLAVPIAAVALALTRLVVPADAPSALSRGDIDVIGATTATAGLLALVYALTNAGRSGWQSPATVATLSGGLVLLAGFVLRQARARNPLMPLTIWRRRGFPAAMIIGCCLFAAWVGGNFYLSLMLQRLLGYRPGEAAVALLPLAIGGLVGSTLAGRLLPRMGAKPLLVGGLAVYVAGFAMMTSVGADTDYWPIVFTAVVLAVVGNSFTYVASTVVALADAPAHEQSLVGGLFNTSMQVGGGLGLAILAVAAATPTGVGNYQSAFLTAAGIACVGLLVAVFFVRREQPSLPSDSTSVG